MTLGWVVGVGHGVVRSPVRGAPLMRTGRALRQLPLVLEEVVEETVVPLRRGGGPDDLQPAGVRIISLAAAEGVPPAKALLLEAGTLGFGTDVRDLRVRSVGLAERVSAGDERNRLLVVHRHASERLADVPGCSKRIWVAVRPLRIHVD